MSGLYAKSQQEKKKIPEEAQNKEEVSAFPIEYDDSIVTFGTDLRWIEDIGSMPVNAVHEIEIDWVE
jgi:hypothetical protein